MAIGAFMPMPVPRRRSGGGGGPVLEGEITVGNFEFFPGFTAYGWSSGMAAPPFGAISGDASSHLDLFFYWSPDMGGLAATTIDITGAILTFQGETAVCAYALDLGAYSFEFIGDTSTWPTSGTHPFTLTLP